MGILANPSFPNFTYFVLVFRDRTSRRRTGRCQRGTRMVRLTCAQDVKKGKKRFLPFPTSWGFMHGQTVTSYEGTMLLCIWPKRKKEGAFLSPILFFCYRCFFPYFLDIFCDFGPHRGFLLCDCVFALLQSGSVPIRKLHIMVDSKTSL